MIGWQKFSIHKWLILAALTLLGLVLSLCIGSVGIPVGQVIRVLMGRDTSSAAARIVLFTRLPRTCAALLAGAALAVAGAVIQTVLHNPLASPGLMGVNSGAGLTVAVLAPFLLWPRAGCQWRPLSVRWQVF